MVKLVLSNAGTLYPAHVGAVIRLAEEGYEFKEVCGISGGSIIAAGLGSGYAPNDELTKLVKKTLPSKHSLMKKSKWSLFFNHGMIKNSKLVSLFSTFLVGPLSNTRLPTYIATTELSTNKPKVFSSINDGDIPLSMAVVASFATPMMFEPVKIKDQFYVDGCLGNSTLEMFDDGEETILITVDSAKVKKENVTSLTGKVSACNNSFVNSLNKKPIHRRGIKIESTYPSFDFTMTDADVDNLVAEGYKSASRWLAKQRKK